MKVALLQYPIAWADKERNLRQTEARLSALAEKADVALLPEMFSTGFCTDKPELAERVDGPTMQRLQVCADRYHVAVVGAFICEDGGRLYNRAFFVRPKESPIFIDKRHLYAHGGEAEFFTAGSVGRDDEVITYRGARFRLLVCYDLRFPVWARSRREKEYDILLVMANWPSIRIQYWDVLVPARAIENQCYIAAVNRVGDDGMGLHYNGHSVAYDTRLQALVRFSEDEAGTQIADFDMQKLWHFRDILPLWRDADAFALDSAH